MTTMDILLVLAVIGVVCVGWRMAVVWEVQEMKLDTRAPKLPPLTSAGRETLDRRIAELKATETALCAACPLHDAAKQKKEHMKVNLHKLACKLAKTDDPKGRNIDVISMETAMAALGDEALAAGADGATAIWAAILASAAKRRDK